MNKKPPMISHRGSSCVRAKLRAWRARLLILSIFRERGPLQPTFRSSLFLALSLNPLYVGTELSGRDMARIYSVVWELNSMGQRVHATARQPISDQFLRPRFFCF